MARLSMREVAALAQVSVGTVSNVLNNPDLVSPETRARVQSAIDELGWVPNRQAQQLRAGRGRTIGLAVMDVANPFFADLLRGAQKELSSNGFGATIGDADNNADLQQKVLRSFLAQRVRGVILGPIGRAPSVVDELQRAGIPTVLVDRAASDKGACTVGMDDEAGGRMAVEHLLRRGHRSVAFVGGPATLDQVRDRLSGATAAAREAAATLTTLAVPQLDFPSGRLAADRIGAMSAAERPTGVFCANDMAAIGLLQGLTSMGIRVPDDIAIIGYDDIEFAAYAAVPLTSVAQPRRDIGATAATLLLAELEDLEAGRPHVHRSVMFTPSLVERASTALA